MSGISMPPKSALQQLADEHRDWLSGFDARHLTNWDKLLSADNEAALAEADVRRRLQDNNVDVEPNDAVFGNAKSLDFRCQSHGVGFCVEVTCIRIATAEEVTGTPKVPTEDHPCRPLTQAIFNKCLDKAAQAASVQQPVLVAIGTWHGFVALKFKPGYYVNTLLTGECEITWDMNITTGESSKTYLSTDLYPAIFLKPNDDGTPKPARQSISGVMLCAFGMPGVEPLIVLNPNAVRPFASKAIPKLPYGSVQYDSQNRVLGVRWKRGSDD
jgi:hypothetical protein